MPTVVTDKFPMTITYVDQCNGRRERIRAESADDDIPPIPPGHWVIVECADGSSGHIADAPRARAFDVQGRREGIVWDQ